MSVDIIGGGATVDPREKIEFERVDFGGDGRSRFVEELDRRAPGVGPVCGWSGDPSMEPTAFTIEDTLENAKYHNSTFKGSIIHAAYAGGALVGFIFGIAYSTHAEINILCAKRKERRGIGSELLARFERDHKASTPVGTPAYVVVTPTRAAMRFYANRGYEGHEPDDLTLTKTL